MEKFQSTADMMKLLESGEMKRVVEYEKGDDITDVVSRLEENTFPSLADAIKKPRLTRSVITKSENTDTRSNI